MRTFAAVVALLGTLAVPAAARAQGTAIQRISGAHIVALARHAIAAISVPADGELVPVGTVRDQIVGQGAVALHVESPLVSASYVNVPIDVDVDGTFVRTLFVGYRLQRFVRTAVAARDLVAGTVLQADDVTLARVPSNGRPPNGTEVLVGRKIFCAFRKGQPIDMEQTQTNQIVAPGASVVLIVNDGGVSVVAEVVARTGGGLGDSVNVYNPETNKTLSGTVVGPDRVQLDIMGVNSQ